MRLGAGAEVLEELREHVLLALQDGRRLGSAAGAAGARPDPRHVATLIASYSSFARLAQRDEQVLEAAGLALDGAAVGWSLWDTAAARLRA